MARSYNREAMFNSGFVSAMRIHEILESLNYISANCGIESYDYKQLKGIQK